MKVLITGATGTIGCKLVELCHQKGWSVNYLTTSKEKIVNQVNYQGFYWNPNKEEIDPICLQDVHTIINLVGATVANRWTPEYKEEIINSRTKTAKLLYNAIKNGNYSVKKIVSASAIGLYPSSLTNYYDENYPEKSHHFLGQVVQQWEEAIDRFTFLNIDVTKLRIGIVLSKNEGALPKMAKPIKLGVGAAFGNGKQWQSWIHIDDLVNMFVYVIENNIKGIVNAVAPNPVSNAELTKAVAKQLDKPLWLPNIPKAALKLVLGDMHEILFDSQRVSSKRIENLGFTFEHYNLKSALEDLF